SGIHSYSRRLTCKTIPPTRASRQSAAGGMLSPVVGLLDRIGGGARAAMLALLAYQGFVLAMNGVAAPWMMRTFALEQSGIARLFAVTSVSALGAFLLARLADRLGRRAVL